ncbi:jg17841 [Pararge aegeria aegeria]|uniref:Odorant receptor n=1 Tax=Pararge aegeria aegeria TaxID=348720 RepID=A0A8S4SMN5_9NEOP|nr:jg17841 [Pararge aegeria aegeria]
MLSSSEKVESTLNTDKVSNIVHFLEVPLKFVGFWDWYRTPRTEFQIFINNIYVGFILFTLTNLLVSLIVYLYSEWTDILGSLDIMADGLPLVASIFIIPYFSIYKSELYELVEFMHINFKWHSARGLTNMTMMKAYRTAKNFAYCYTACVLFSITTYVLSPVILHWWMKQPFEYWDYVDVTQGWILVLIFLRQCLSQYFMALSIGQFDIYSSVYDDATVVALQDCAKISQVVKEFKDRFEKFVSPLLAVRVIQVTMYLCTLLYAASLELEIVTIEYLCAVALDIFVYCYFGNQIILQADRVAAAGYQCTWVTMGIKPRRLLLNIMLSNHKPMLLRVANFLPMNLNTFVLVI